MLYVGNKRYTPFVGNTKSKVMTKRSLPYDAEIEYLQSTGTQLIDTGIQGGTSCEYSLTFQVLSENISYAHLCGSSNPATAPQIYIEKTSTTMRAVWNGRNMINIFSSSAFYEKHTIDYKEGGLYLDDVLKASPGLLGFGNLNFCLFGYHGENLPIKAKIFACKIWKDGSLIRDYIPVRVEQVGYMYDKVSEQLFGNSGTGSFTLGKDITTVHDYVTDGLVFHLDGIEKGATDGSWIDLVGGKVFTANNSTYIQPAVDGFTFIGGSNAFNAMTYSNGLVGTTTWTMESACSPTAWNTGATRALFTSSNRGCGLSLRGDFHWTNGSNKGWENDILSQQLPKVTLSMNADMGVLNGEQLTTTKGGEQMTTSGFQVGSCQNKNYNFVGTIHSIRMYNRSLTLEERLHNQRIDNIRFNLGLNI